MTTCINYIGALDSSKCILINEASSSKTAFFSFNSALGVNPILVDGKPKTKYSLSDPDNRDKYSVDSYALKGDIYGYYNIMFNSVIENHILNANCSVFYWALLATGGMRNLADNEGYDIVSSFYSGIQSMFDTNQNVCGNGICKEVVLIRAETISGAEEGQYAWLTLQQTSNDNCHAVIDLGGQTGQFANQTFAYSDYLGKDRAIGHIASANDYNYTITPCYNDQNQYNGIACRDVISSYVTTYLSNNLPSVNYAQYCTFYTISNFYNYFNDICGSYYDYIRSNNLPVNPSTWLQIQNLCIMKKASQSFDMGLSGYQNITDEVCNFWNNNWSGKTASYAKDACFAGNYNYQILKAFGLSDAHLLKLQFMGNDVTVDPSDWALGSAFDSINNCNIAPSNSGNCDSISDKFSNNCYTGQEMMWVGIGGFVSVMVVGLSVYGKYNGWCGGAHGPLADQENQ